MRLTRAAREGGAALVTLGTSASMASLRLTSRLLHYRWRRTPFGDPACAEDATVRDQRESRRLERSYRLSSFRSCIMSYVCLWSPSWPTGADFPADLVAGLLAVAPRVVVGERRLVWGDARGLHGGQLANDMLRVTVDYGFDDVRAGVASTQVAAEVAATQSESPLVIVKPGQDRAFIAPYKLERADAAGASGGAASKDSASRRAARSPRSTAEAIEVRLGVEGVRFWKRARADDDRCLFTIPIRPFPSASVEWVEYGLKDPERLLFVINSLAGTVCTSLDRARRARARDGARLLARQSHAAHARDPLVAAERGAEALDAAGARGARHASRCPMR